MLPPRDCRRCVGNDLGWLGCLFLCCSVFGILSIHIWTVHLVERLKTFVIFLNLCRQMPRFICELATIAFLAGNLPTSHAWPCIEQIESCDYVCDLLLGYARCESGPGHWLFWLKFVLIFLSTSRNVLGSRLKPGHDRSSSLSSAIYCSLTAVTFDNLQPDLRTVSLTTRVHK